jgi:hypothetical protein
MRKHLLCVGFAFLALSVNALSQSNNPAYQQQDPITNISVELSRISRSVQSLNERLQSFLNKFEAIGGVNYTEKQQKLLLGLEFLVRSEQRLATLQRFQIELTEKQASTRARLAEIEEDLRPEKIDRSVSFEGSTNVQELRDIRTRRLLAERGSMQTLLSQINFTLSDTNQQLKETQELVQRLRKQVLFEVEKETSNS